MGGLGLALQPLRQGDRRPIPATGDLDDPACGSGNPEGLKADPGHQAPRDAVALLLIRAGEAKALGLQVLLPFREPARAHHRPGQATLLEPAFPQPLPEQDQAEQVERVEEPSAAQGADQHHPSYPGSAAGVDLGADRQGIHFERAAQVDRRSGPGGDHQGGGPVEGLLQGGSIAQFEAHELGPLQTRRDNGAGPHDRPDLVTLGECLLHHPPTGLAGGPRDGKQARAGGVGHQRLGGCPCSRQKAWEPVPVAQWRPGSPAMASPSFALAPPCPSPGPRPRQWQLRLIDLLRRRLEQVDGGHDPGAAEVLIHAGPGAGKTLGALLAFQRLRREGRLTHLLVFCHRSSIAAQWRAAASQLGLELGDGPLAPAPPPEGGGVLLSYQGAARRLEQIEAGLAWPAGARVLAVADEVHHLGFDPEEPDGAVWGQAFHHLSRHCVLRLGLSGTPFRADNLAFRAARCQRHWEQGELVERIAADLTVEPRQLIAAGDVRPLEFRFQDGWVEHGRPGETERSSLSVEQRESWRARNLRRAIQPGDASSIALRLLLQARRRLEMLRAGDHPEAGGLVIARDIAHARRIAGLLEEEGDPVLLVHSQDPEAAERLQAFRGGAARWLVSIDMCAEGFDAPRLRVVAYLSTVVTRSRFLQAITRAVRMEASRCALEGIPRQASYVFAPADPRLIAFARTWSVAEPYRIRPQAIPTDPAAGGGGGGNSLPLEALAEGVGEMIRLRGPELPHFLARP